MTLQIPPSETSADAMLCLIATIKNQSERQTPDGTKLYAIAETLNPFGDKEAFFIKLNDGITFADLAVGQRYLIPVLHYVGDNRRLFLRTNPAHPPQRLDG